MNIPNYIAGHVSDDAYQIWCHVDTIGMADTSVKRDLIDMYFKDPNRSMTMSYPKNLPNPTLPHEDFCAAMADMSEQVNLRHFRDASGKERRLWLIESARRITTGTQAKVFAVEMHTISDERINHYGMTEEARLFWQNGREQGLTNKEILDGWTAMQSIMKDDKSEEDKS